MTDKGSEKFNKKIEMTYYDFNKAANNYLLKFVDAFREKYGKEEALKLAEELSDKNANTMAKRTIAKTPINNFEDFKKVITGILNTAFKDAVIYETTENTEKKLTFIITECLYAKTFQELEEPDFGYSLSCHGDFEMAKAFHPKIKLTRTKTLMQGDDHCDICYTWED